VSVHRFLIILASLALAACSGSDGGGQGSCSNRGQKIFVRDAMQDWYLWNNLLPDNIPVRDYDSPEALLADLTTYSPDDGSGNPIDIFSFIGSAAADAAFFGQGQFEGFGFGLGANASILQVFAGSPADLGGLARGQQILELDGRTVAAIEAAEGLNAALSVTPLTLLMLEPGGAQLTTTIAHDIVTINPVPQSRVIAANDGSGRMVGYIELSTFIGTADPAFDTVFADFIANGVNDVILDLRYNGGGLVNTANLLGDYLGGGVPAGDVFSDTRFNADRALINNSLELFDRLGNSLNVSRFIVIASSGTASASELVINGMAPHVAVTIVGGTTFGKPIGQVGFEFCDKIFRPTAFQTFNADGFGDYFGGLPVDCPVADDLTIAVGADADPNMIAAMGYLDTGLCPVIALPAVASKAQLNEQAVRPDRRGPPWREYAGAF